MQIFGHRGAHGEAPENTLTAFQFLRDQGIHCVEFDVRLDKGGEPIVIHDESLSRTTNGQGLVSEHHATVLGALDARKHWKSTFSQRDGIPRLETVLKAWPDIESVQIEVKEMPQDQCHIAARRIVEICQHLKLQQRATITSLHIPFLQHLKSSRYDQPTGLVVQHKLQNPVQQAIELGCSYLCLRWDVCNPSTVKKAHEAGLHVSVWVVNDQEHLKTLNTWGVDSIITDYPSRLVKPY